MLNGRSRFPSSPAMSRPDCFGDERTRALDYSLVVFHLFSKPLNQVTEPGDDLSEGWIDSWRPSGGSVLVTVRSQLGVYLWLVWRTDW